MYLISILDIDRYSYSDRYGHRYKLTYKYRYICTEFIKPLCPLTQMGPLRHKSLCRTSVIPWRWGLNFDTVVRRERLPSWHERRLTIALFRRSDFPGFWELLLGMCGVTRVSEVGDTEENRTRHACVLSWFRTGAWRFCLAVFRRVLRVGFLWMHSAARFSSNFS